MAPYTVDSDTVLTVGLESSPLAREGLEVLRDAPAERRAVLLETSAFAEFLLEQIPKFQEEWEAQREALVASGELPAPRPGETRRQ
jgi:hypothetical protein